MPTIAIVDGVTIRMFYNDHTPPRFHAILGEHELLVTIRDLDVLQGSLPPARLRRELAWAAKHQSELALNQMSGQSGAGTDLNVPKVLDNIITASEPDPNTFEVTVTWATGDKTIHQSVTWPARACSPLSRTQPCSGRSWLRAWAQPGVAGRDRLLRRRALARSASGGGAPGRHNTRIP